MRKVVQKVANQYSKWRLRALLPEAVADVEAYAKRSNTTGTQWFTLWLAVRSILKHRPNWVLEAGTGSSTLVFAATVQKLRQQDPGFEGRIVSMESVPEWYDVAKRNLPEKYADVVEIVLGPREKFEMAMFRGYTHSNIPKHDYGFVLIDGPAFQDENGVSFCADIFRAMELSDEPIIHGVSDGRASTVLVIQQIYGVRAARYWHGLYAAGFSLPSIPFRDSTLKTTKDFSTSWAGRLEFIKFR